MHFPFPLTACPRGRLAPQGTKRAPGECSPSALAFDTRSMAFFSVSFNLKSTTTFPSGEIAFCKVATILRLIFVEGAKQAVPCASDCQRQTQTEDSAVFHLSRPVSHAEPASGWERRPVRFCPERPVQKAFGAVSGCGRAVALQLCLKLPALLRIQHFFEFAGVIALCQRFAQNTAWAVVQIDQGFCGGIVPE